MLQLHVGVCELLISHLLQAEGLKFKDTCLSQHLSTTSYKSVYALNYG